MEIKKATAASHSIFGIIPNTNTNNNAKILWHTTFVNKEI